MLMCEIGKGRGGEQKYQDLLHYISRRFGFAFSLSAGGKERVFTFPPLNLQKRTKGNGSNSMGTGGESGNAQGHPDLCGL